MKNEKSVNINGEKKHKRLLNFLDFVAILVAFVLILSLLSPILTPKNILGQSGKYNYMDVNFRAEKANSIDVMFVGNSNLYNSVSPMCIWNNDGITSDVSGKPSQKPENVYKILNEMYKTQSPKAVFIEMDMFFKKPKRINHGKNDPITINNKAKNSKNVFNNSTKGMSKTQKKFRKALNKTVNYAIKCGKNFDDVVLSTLSEYIPAFKFHDNWKTFDFSVGFNFDRIVASEYKGFIPKTEVNGYNYGFDYMEKSRKLINELRDTENLEKMINLCKSKGSEVVLFSVPSAISASYSRHCYIANEAKKYGVIYVDLNGFGIVKNFDWKTDSRDFGDHLNIRGAQNVSVYLADYLKKNFKFSDKRKDASYSLWNEANEKYKKLLMKNNISFGM